ncbi:cation:proton antiporter [Streptomyces luomodiensis]|uniref:Cation:proton antiporter n=1 Tax=Streptomyces luomodiensis TaxID=3026192 RepID=A0ABY9V5I8_9ACTN|nr:cation:proton antiporter [Streptomyces sp. SCA4-21]WNF00143.1 cation:proton antiporter [Streptomyces sp. SCA4-21]
MAMSGGALEETIRDVLIGLAVVVPVALFCGRIAQRLRQPAVLGEIAAGLMLGPSLLGMFPGDPTGALFPAEARPFLQLLAQLGLVLFMFGVGYHLDVAHLRGRGRQVMSVSFSSVALPFALGTGLAVGFATWGLTERGRAGLLGPALFLGAAMSITAFPVLARILTDHGLARERIGNVALACAALQDLLAWGILAVVVVVVNADGPWPLARMALLSTLFVLGMRYVVRPALRRLLAPERPWNRDSALAQGVVFGGLLLSAWATDAMGLHTVFGAFVFGAVVPRRQLEAHAPDVPARIEQSSLLLLPVFFAVTGLSVDFQGLGAQGLVMLLAVLLVACAGKFVGAAVAARLTGATPRQSITLGVLLNARGLTELVLLNVGLALGVIDGRLFTVMVAMAVITTMMTGPLLQRLSPAPRSLTVGRGGEHGDAGDAKGAGDAEGAGDAGASAEDAGVAR